MTIMFSLQGLPRDGAPGTVALYAVVLTSMGSLISWAAPCFNNPAFSELVWTSLGGVLLMA